MTAGVDEEHNIGLVSRELQKTLDSYTLPDGYTVTLSGESETINSAMFDLLKMMALAIVFIYLIMVAPVSYTHLDVYKRQVQQRGFG